MAGGIKQVLLTCETNDINYSNVNKGAIASPKLTKNSCLMLMGKDS